MVVVEVRQGWCLGHGGYKMGMRIKSSGGGRDRGAFYKPGDGEAKRRRRR
jgi:hypothetical protein